MSVSIAIRDFAKEFQTSDGSRLRVLENVDLQVAPGEFVTILGPSGCGKSTLLNALSGLDTSFEGKVEIGRSAVGAAKPRIAYLFQEPRLLPWRTVRGNIEFALDAARVPKSEWPARCERWLEAVGLSSFADYFPLQLSGGMQQRVSIARAFSIEPELMLMDEPFSALDEITALRMRQLLLSLWEADRRTVLFVTHNSLESVYLSDRIVVMKSGPNSRICDEIGLSHLRRPRKYDDPAQYETQRTVLATLMRYV